MTEPILNTLTQRLDRLETAAVGESSCGLRRA